MHSAIAAVAALTLVASASARAAEDIIPERSDVLPGTLSAPSLPVVDTASTRVPSAETVSGSSSPAPGLEASDRSIVPGIPIPHQMPVPEEAMDPGPRRPGRWWISAHGALTTMLTSGFAPFGIPGVEAGDVSQSMEIGFGFGGRVEYRFPRSRFSVSIGIGYDSRSIGYRAPAVVDTTVLLHLTPLPASDNPTVLVFESRASGLVTGMRVEMLGKYDIGSTNLSVMAGLGCRVSGAVRRRETIALIAPRNVRIINPAKNHFADENDGSELVWFDGAVSGGIPVYAKLGAAYRIAMGSIEISPWAAADWQLTPLMRGTSWQAVGLMAGVELALPVGR